MFYVASNSEVYHLTKSEEPTGESVCGIDHSIETASVVVQEPGEGFRMCLRCQAVKDG